MLCDILTLACDIASAVIKKLRLQRNKKYFFLELFLSFMSEMVNGLYSFHYVNIKFEDEFGDFSIKSMWRN